MPERTGEGVVMPLRMMQPEGSAVNQMLLPLADAAAAGGYGYRWLAAARPPTVTLDPSGSARR
jgi:hypothetical protein